MTEEELADIVDSVAKRLAAWPTPINSTTDIAEAFALLAVELRS